MVDNLLLEGEGRKQTGNESASPRKMNVFFPAFDRARPRLVLTAPGPTPCR